MSKIIDRTVFEDALYDADIQWDESLSEVVRTDYSGRGMYGENCFGLVLGTGAFADIYSIVRALTEKGVFDADLGEDVEFVRSMRTDSMGYSTIYYFPGYVLPKSDRCEQCGKQIPEDDTEARSYGVCRECGEV